MDEIYKTSAKWLYKSFGACFDLRIISFLPADSFFVKHEMHKIIKISISNL